MLLLRLARLFTDSVVGAPHLGPANCCRRPACCCCGGGGGGDGWGAAWLAGSCLLEASGWSAAALANSHGPAG